MKKMETIVMIPTYNESGNIEQLLKALLGLRQDIGCVVVDDNSPDGTAKLVQKMIRKYSGRVKLIVRKNERGRATAGIAGHKAAIALKPRYIVEMDADFSHDPKYVVTFLEEIKNCDVVLGSRFVPGGKDSDRSPFRTFVSILSGHVFRAILGMRIRDIGSGYKLYRREVLEALPWDEFLSYGIAISMEEIFRIVKLGYRVKEVPIVFVDRHAGESKLRWKDFLEPVRICLMLVSTLGRA